MCEVQKVYICAGAQHAGLIASMRADARYRLTSDLRQADACLVFWRKGEEVPAAWEHARKVLRPRTQVYQVSPSDSLLPGVPPGKPGDKPRTFIHWDHLGLPEALGTLLA